MRALADLTSAELAEMRPAECVLLLPIGSTEPHGPHLPLGTDEVLSRGVSREAAAALEERGIRTLVLPSIAYGVTDFAAGFAGAVSVPAEVLTPFVHAIVHAVVNNGFRHVCLINNHLEPEHDAAIRRAADGFPPGRVTVASPLSRRWARTLSDEFKRGNCHAGQYETSLMMHLEPGLVRDAIALGLADSEVSLSDGIRNGLVTFAAMGMDRAYTGSPRCASAEEGRDLASRLVTMVVTEVEEALSSAEKDLT